MFNTVRSCVKFAAKRNIKHSSHKKPKPSRKTQDPLPIFSYPTSQPGEHRVYVWGLAEHGGLGTIEHTRHIKGIAYVPMPKRLSFGEFNKVINVTCGYGFTAFGVNSKDKNIVYGSGINTDSQLGFIETDEKKYPDDIITEPRPIPLPLKSSSAKVIDLAAGRAHLLVLTDEGLFTLGNNGYGQCGRIIIPEESYHKSKIIHHIPNIKGKQITGVTAGQDHSILLTESGELYSFGWGADGQTGLAHYRNECQPSLIKGDLAGQRIIKVACAADCVLALSDKGKVYGWGNSEYNQLLLTEDQQINIATELNLYDDLGRIVDIAAGGSFCMVLNNEGHVYVWGYGILGLGPEVERVKIPQMIPETLFGKNIYQQNTKIVSIYAGINHLGALTNKGDLFMWGCNKFGSLGLGHQNNQFFPFKVSVGAQVKKIACGVDHNVAICKPFI
ncbi:RCC1-like G exchanging factor-like protein [Prorops nasuta]|uniref:RCC1-like G exchanging factor-like protein n=1 Tax=Prorops nasuta TaxID=863751 RepID=UPI0034CF97F5